MTIFGLVLIVGIVLFLAAVLRGARRGGPEASTGGRTLITLHPLRMLIWPTLLCGLGVFLIVQGDHLHDPSLAVAGSVCLLIGGAIGFFVLRSIARAAGTFFR